MISVEWFAFNIYIPPAFFGWKKENEFCPTEKYPMSRQFWIRAIFSLGNFLIATYKTRDELSRKCLRKCLLQGKTDNYWLPLRLQKLKSKCSIFPWYSDKSNNFLCLFYILLNKTLFQSVLFQFFLISCSLVWFCSSRVQL